MLKYPVWLIDFMKILCHGKWFSYYSLWQTLCLCCRCVCAHGGGVWCGGAALAPTGHQPAAAYVDRVLPTPLRLREQRPPRLQHSLRSRSLADCVLPTPLRLREQRPPWLQHSQRSRTLADCVLPTPLCLREQRPPWLQHSLRSRSLADCVLHTPLRLREQRPPQLQHSLRSRSLADCVLPTPLCLREQRPPWLQHSLRSRTLADRSKVIIKTWIRWSLHTSLGTQQCVLGNSDSVKLILLFPRVTNLWNAAYFKVKLSDCCID